MNVFHIRAANSNFLFNPVTMVVQLQNYAYFTSLLEVDFFLHSKRYVEEMNPPHISEKDNQTEDLKLLTVGKADKFAEMKLI